MTKNKTMRDVTALRYQAHDLFDQLWKRGVVSRELAYQKLSAWLEIPQCDCHFGRMTEPQLRRAIEFLKDLNVQTYRERNHDYRRSKHLSGRLTRRQAIQRLRLSDLEEEAA